MESQYLDRLAPSEPLDLWQAEELADALAVLDDFVGRRRQPGGEPRVLNIRLQIYRHRLQRELDHRTDAPRRGT